MPFEIGIQYCVVVLKLRMNGRYRMNDLLHDMFLRRCENSPAGVQRSRLGNRLEVRPPRRASNLKQVEVLNKIMSYFDDTL
jgi:hypothetical protein